MIRTLIEVFLFSAGFLALCYFVIKYMHYEPHAGYSLTAQGADTEVMHLAKGAQAREMLKGQTGVSLPHLSGRNPGAAAEALPATPEGAKMRVNRFCPEVAQGLNCTGEQGASTLIAGYLWEDNHMDVNIWLTQE